MNENNYQNAPPPEALMPPPKPPLDPVATFVLPVLRSKSLLIVMVSIGVFGGVVFSLMLPNEYTSNGKVRLLLGMRERYTPESPDDPQRIGGKAAVLEELYLLRNPAVYDRVAEMVGPVGLLQPYDPAAQDTAATPAVTRKMHEFQSWWFGRSNRAATHQCTPVADGSSPLSCPVCIRAASQLLQGRTEIGNDGKSTIISVNFTSHDPQLARRVVSAYLETFNDVHHEKFSAKRSVDLIQQRREEEELAAQRAEQALLSFSREHRISDIATQISNLVDQEQTLIGAIKADEAQVLISNKELTKIAEELKVVPATEFRDRPPTQILNPRRTEIQATLGVQQGLRLDLIRKGYKAESDQVKDIDAVIADLRTELAELPQFIDREQAPEEVENRRYTHLRDKELEHSELARTLTTKIEEEKKRLGDISQRLTELKTHRVEYEKRVRQAKRHRDNVSQYTRQLDKLRIAEKLDEAEQSNLEVWQPATLPLKKSGPNRMRFVLAGLALGSFLGIGIALARGFIDRTVRRPRDIEQALGVRVLGVVPYSGGWDRAQRTSKKIPREELNIGSS